MIWIFLWSALGQDTDVPTVEDETTTTEAVPEEPIGDLVESPLEIDPEDDTHLQAHQEAIEHVEHVTEQSKDNNDTLDALIKALEAKARAEGKELPPPVLEKHEEDAAEEATSPIEPEGPLEHPVEQDELDEKTVESTPQSDQTEAEEPFIGPILGPVFGPHPQP